LIRRELIDTTCFKTYYEVMNKPFKPDPIVPILADVGVSISDLKRNPAAVIEAARSQQVAILNRNKPVAYVIAPHVWEYLCDLVLDQRVMREAEEELANEDAEGIEVDLADYL
jgi:antitoxin StbD